jgi:DNA-3-methyladenine glycosylase
VSALRALTRADLPRTTVELAAYLLGRVIVHDTDEGRTSGRIVETEAYLADDPASHSFRGRSKRNGSMFLERGHAYVYFIYGMQYCLNVTSEDEGTGAAVLLRALEPLEGIELMRRRRGKVGDRDLTRGPGRLVQALGAGPADDGADLCAGAGLYLACDETAVAMGQSVRIGITKAADRPLRFFVPGNLNVSGPRGLSRRGEDA